MSSVLNLVENYESSEFYPTPPELAEKMIKGITLDRNMSILEPSAGKGDILRVLAKHEDRDYFDIDCIEIDPNLRQILKWQFGERYQSIKWEMEEIKNKYGHVRQNYYNLRSKEDNEPAFCYYNEKADEYIPLPKEDDDRLVKLGEELDYFFDEGIHIVHDDFLTYNSYKKYDLIIMNPPFSNGVGHLLKALHMQKKGGDVVCLLNAETIKNPYTAPRKKLQELLNKYNASIEFISEAFSNAERKTGVEVALVKVHIESVVEESDIYHHFKVAEDVEEPVYEATAIELPDEIKARVNLYNLEVKSGIELIRQYNALVPYMFRSFDDRSSYYSKEPLLVLTLHGKSSTSSVSVNDYLKKVRYKYWSSLLANHDFMSKLTNSLQEEYRNKIDELVHYEFSEFNIYNLSIEMAARVLKGVEEEAEKMFEKLTAEHTWIPQSSNNRLYYDGWKTNKAHKIGKKVILPCYNAFDSYDGKPNSYRAGSQLEDIERVLNYLDGGMTREILNIHQIIENHFRVGVTKNIKLKFFTVTFYKKGTVHITFNCPQLIDRYNIYAGKRKGWLPPCYGKQVYQNMNEEEKAVIDSFQGETAYNEVMARADYYLAELSTPRKQAILGEKV
ncbi:MAG: DUF4942 domain-containing protein [Bacteroidales bacterium]|nr:DUF4942 domain-containing protein [Bacteroidales bacterium]